MSEANARPVLPASAKAASVVAASVVASSNVSNAGNSSVCGSVNKLQAIEQQQQQQQQSGKDNEKKSQHQQISSACSSSSNTTGSGSLASSFVSSETLTSNLRKMIVSSSATIGRKLNISGTNNNNNSSSASGSVCSTASGANVKPPIAAKPPEITSDFEQRQANYRHPVIQSADKTNNQLQRPKSCSSRVRLESVSGDNNNNNSNITLIKRRDDNNPISSSHLLGSEQNKQLQLIKQSSQSNAPASSANLTITSSDSALDTNKHNQSSRLTHQTGCTTTDLANKR